MFLLFVLFIYYFFFWVSVSFPLVRDFYFIIFIYFRSAREYTRVDYPHGRRAVRFVVAKGGNKNRKAARVQRGAKRMEKEWKDRTRWLGGEV